MMRQDVRGDLLYREAESLHQVVRQPGAGLISDAAEVSTHGKTAVFAGTLVQALVGSPPTRICAIDLETGDVRVLTSGPNSDRLPKFSPDGRHIAFLSDRSREGDFQLYFLDPQTGAAQSGPQVPGWVEYFHWSPDSQHILLGVAGHGADIAGAQGAVTSKHAPVEAPSWMPSVESEDEAYRWRRMWVCELASHSVKQVGGQSVNAWEAVWCGPEAIAAIVSDSPDEAAWYRAGLHIIDLRSGKNQQLYAPKDQLGWPAASPSGNCLAFVEAVCSDRGIVAGDLKIMEVASGRLRSVDTRRVDVSCTEWQSDDLLLVAGHRGFHTVVASYDLGRDRFSEAWSSDEITSAGRHVTVAGIRDGTDCLIVGEGFARAPEMAIIRRGSYRTIRSFDLGYESHINAMARVEQVSWSAPDGLECQGWLLLPLSKGPHPLVMNIHGGPVWQWRPMWLGRSGVTLLMLLKRGYAIFFPNPRGSTGRGQEFARGVLGDMGGADTYDYLSGLDALVAQGIADASRLGVTGGSYGGYMTSWLITQDARFGAAVSVCPVTNHVTEHLLSNIPHFVAMFLDDTYDNPGGKYFQRSPLMHVRRAKTPTLNICGALDRCTPPQEAIQFHNALRENGAESVLVVYPEEGHGIRKWPAVFDYSARVVSWFQDHIPVKDARAEGG